MKLDSFDPEKLYDYYRYLCAVIVDLPYNFCESLNFFKYFSIEGRYYEKIAQKYKKNQFTARKNVFAKEFLRFFFSQLDHE